MILQVHESVSVYSRVLSMPHPGCQPNCWETPVHHAVHEGSPVHLEAYRHTVTLQHPSEYGWRWWRWINVLHHGISPRTARTCISLYKKSHTLCSTVLCYCSQMSCKNEQTDSHHQIIMIYSTFCATRLQWIRQVSSADIDTILHFLISDNFSKVHHCRTRPNPTVMLCSWEGNRMPGRN